MEKMKKENVLKTISVSLAYLIGFAIVSRLVNLCVQLFYYFTYSTLRVSDYEAFAQEVNSRMQANVMGIGLLSFVVFFAIILIIFKAKKASFLTHIKWNPVSKQMYFMVAVLAISNIVAINFLMDFLFPQSWSQGASDYATTLTSRGSFLNAISIVLFVPFGEELLFRGLITGRLL